MENLNKTVEQLTYENLRKQEEKVMNETKLLTVEEVAYVLGVSVKTINNWYAFKRKNPENELVKILPDFIQEGKRQTRKWSEDSIELMRVYKNSIPKGRNGVMGSVTQCYYKKGPHRKESATVIKQKSIAKKVFDILDENEVDKDVIFEVMAVLIA